MQFHRDEMKRARDRQTEPVSKIAAAAVLLNCGEGLKVRQHQVHRKRFCRIGHKPQADEIGGAANGSVSVPLKVGKPGFGVGLPHQKVDIESRAEVGVKVNGVPTYQDRFESFGPAPAARAMLSGFDIDRIILQAFPVCNNEARDQLEVGGPAFAESSLQK